jgi:hypothetical protein
MRVKNKSWSPLAVSLPGGKSLTLAARGTSEISSEDFQSPELQRLFEARNIIVLPEEKEKPSGTESEPSSPKASTPEHEESDSRE